MASPSLCAPTGLGAEFYPVPNRKKPAAEGEAVEMSGVPGAGACVLRGKTSGLGVLMPIDHV